MRLNKFMASAGVASRRNCDEIITQGRVRINGRVVKKLGVQIDPNCDLISVDNKPLRLKGEFIYLVLNKPVGVVSTVKDPEGRRTVMDCLPALKYRVYPVGRLDFNTSGLLLFTNNGDITQKLIHPSFELNKVYLATIDGQLSDESVQKLRNGVNIGDYITRPAEVEMYKQQFGQTTYKVTIHEGKNRQVRRMFEAVDSKLAQLKRIQFGKILLGDLPVGQTRQLTQEEVEYITSL